MSFEHIQQDGLSVPAREPLQGKVKPSQLPQGPHGRALCRWCQNEVPPNRRTFCSAPCVHEHKLRSSIDYMKNQVFERDAGLCALCNLDCGALLRSTQSLAAAEGEEKAIQALIEKGFNPFRAAQAVQKGAALWDADHIVAVSQGGGGCGLSGMRTLCAPCHKGQTRDLRRALAQGLIPGQMTIWDFMTE